MVKKFVTSQRRETHQSAKVVLTIIEDLITENGRDKEMLVLIMHATIVRILEHAMLVEENVPSRAAVFTIISAFVKAPAFLGEIEVR